MSPPQPPAGGSLATATAALPARMAGRSSLQLSQGWRVQQHHLESLHQVILLEHCTRCSSELHTTGPPRGRGLDKLPGATEGLEESGGSCKI